jgi:hypothetical protein
MDLIDYECLDLLRKRIHQVILLVWAEIILWEPTLILTMRIDMNHCKGRFTLWPKVERPSISINHIARNQEFSLSTLHTMAKVQRRSQLKIITFWRRQQTLEGSLGRMGMETQTMVKRPSVFFLKFFLSLTRSWPLDWRGYFEQGIK